MRGFFILVFLVSSGAPLMGAEATREETIRMLASESFAEREEATRVLWAEGELALDALNEAARSSDPEMALRARDLLRKIDLGITPDTDPKITALTERYRSANQNDKTRIFQELRQLRAWRQILKLYATETDASTRDNLARMVDGIALHAARERLAVGDQDGALEYLELARGTEGGLISIAAFHRARGTLDREIKAVGEPAGADELMWLTALHRVAGDARSAAETATAGRDKRLAAAMNILLGDPLPWLEHAATLADDRNDPAAAHYSRAAAARWRGDRSIPEFDFIRRQLRSHDETTRLRGITHLFLLGEPESAWRVYAHHHPEESFLHYDALERIDDALAVIGLDPEKPDFESYIAPLLATVCKPPGNAADDDVDRDDDTRRLLGICNFLERRGMHGMLDQLVMPRVLEFGGVHAPRFTDLMSELFTVSSDRPGAPELALRIAIRWAGDDERRWNEMMIAAFGEEQGFLEWWGLTGRIEPDASSAERLRGMLALFGHTRDTKNLYERWLDATWRHIDKADDPVAVLQSLEYLAANITDIDLIERLRKATEKPDTGTDVTYGNLLVDTAAGRWDDVAEMFLAQIATLAERGDARAELHAYAAACLRKAGRANEAGDHEVWVETLALGDARANLAIAQAYAFGRDYGRATKWQRRAVIESEPGGNRYGQALRAYVTELMDQREFKLIAACTEVLAQMDAAEASIGITPFNLTRLRQQSDFARALSLPPGQSDEAQRLLRGAHAIMPTDGALADHFFPALRESRFTDLHDELFEISWLKLTAPLARFPDSDNTMNTAGWIAGRSARRLDEAIKIQNRALGLNPRSPAYLDTLGEIHFAMGNRAEAVRLGALAMRYMPHDAMIIRQYERFLHGEMPSR